MGLLEGAQRGEARRAVLAGGSQFRLQLPGLGLGLCDLGVSRRDVAGQGRRPHGTGADRGQIGVALGLHGLDAALQTALLHGELRAQEIPFRGDFGRRQRQPRFRAPPRQARRARVERREQKKATQARRQEAQREDHHRFDHEGAARACGRKARPSVSLTQVDRRGEIMLRSSIRTGSRSPPW
jgi:hypothetical protein